MSEDKPCYKCKEYQPFRDWCDSYHSCETYRDHLIHEKTLNLVALILMPKDGWTMEDIADGAEIVPDEDYKD